MAYGQNDHRYPDVDFAKGETVIVQSSTRATRALGQGTTSLRKGDRLIVTGVHAGWIHARRDNSYSYVWIVDSRLVLPADRPVRYLGDAPEGSIPIDDPRLDYLWRDAAELASRLDFCKEFDRLAALLGAPGRERTYSVAIEVADGVKLTGSLKARSVKEAERLLLDRVKGSPRGPLAIGAGS